MARKWNKRLQHRAEYTLLKGLLFILRRVSLDTTHRIANVLGRLVFSVLRIRRSVTLDNLRSAFPEKSDSELRRIALGAYRNFGKMALEYMRFPVLDKATVLSLCDVRGEEHMQWAIQNGKGAVMVGGHFGNWELMGAYVAQRVIPSRFLSGSRKTGWWTT